MSLDRSSEGSTQARLDRQRWAIATVKTRRLQAMISIVLGMLVVGPALIWLSEFLPASSSGPVLLVALGLTAGGIIFMNFRASRCPVCSAQHAEGGHGLMDTMRYRAGQPQIGRTPNFTCSSCGTRLT